jgi:hypothetical protein
MARTVAASRAYVIVRLDDLRLVLQEENGSPRSRGEIVGAADVLRPAPGKDDRS